MKNTILLAEDDADLRDVFADILRMEGYEVAEAASGESAVELIQGGLMLDLVISDHLMPRGSGLDLLRQIREKVSDTLPFFLMTGQSAVHREEVLQLGAQEFILKPFEFPELLGLISKYLGSE